MRYKKHIAVFVLALLILLAVGGLVVAGDTKTIPAEYNFSGYEKEVPEPISKDSIILEITTKQDSECKYSSSDSNFSFWDEGKSFEPSMGTKHEKVFDIYSLEDGIHNYYIKCINESGSYDHSSNIPVLELEFKVDKKISAEIFLPEDVEPPLTTGRHKIMLETSKPALDTPTLRYYFEEDSPHRMSLSQVSKNLWKGYLIIPENLGDKILSFEFEARDLREREGTRILGTSVFEVDTTAPSPISDIEAIGYEGKIKLKWHYEGEEADFNIYRSKSRNVDKTDSYETTDDLMFTDTFVEAGKTYYYKVAPVDEAGNEARLSLEVSATALSGNASEQDTGLDVQLRGKVDNFVTEADSLISQAEQIKNSIDSKTEDKKELFSLLKLKNKIDGAISKIKSLKRTVKMYKQQDLTETVLDNKLSSARTQLNVIKKTIPEEISIKETETQNNEITKEDIETALLEAKSEMSSSLREKSVERTLEFLEEKNLEIKTDFYVGEIIYFDGSKKDISLVKRTINSNIGKHKNMSFLEIVPKQVAETTDDINFENSAYDVVKEDPIVSFNSDVKQITYSLDKEVSMSSLKETKSVFITIFEEDKGGSGITGHFINIGDVDGTYIGAGIGVLIIGILLFYLFYLRKNKPSQKCMDIKNLIYSSRNSLNNGDLKESIKTYKEIKEKYNHLEKKDKSKVYNELQGLFSKIQVEKLKKGLEDFHKNRDRDLFNKLYKIYQSLSEKDKKKFSKMEKLKEKVENEN